MVVDGTTLVSGTPAGDDEMLRRMDATLARVTRFGAKVLMVTDAPRRAERCPGNERHEPAPSRTRATRASPSVNRRFADRHRDSVKLVDLTPRLCPQGPPCPERVNGLRMRPDGRHFTPTAAAIQAAWLMPHIVAMSKK